MGNHQDREPLLKRLKSVAGPSLQEMSFRSVSELDRTRAVAVVSFAQPGSLREPSWGEVESNLEGIMLQGGGAPPDLATHLVLYKAFPEIGAIVHSQSPFATCWAQARRTVPCLGTRHADFFHGEIPLTETLTEVEVEGDYDYHMGKAIARRFRDAGPLACPAVLVAGHGAFAWGGTMDQAVAHALALEEVARMAWHTLALNPLAEPLEHYTQERHFYRRQEMAARLPG